MRFEVLNKESMEELSKELSKAGIMNKTKEEFSWDIEHFILIKGKYGELKEKVKKISEREVIEGKLEEIERAFNALLSEWNVNESKNIEEVFNEVDINRLILLTALIDSGAIEEEDGKLKLLKKPELDNLEIEIRFPIDDVEEILDEIEEKIGSQLVSEVAFLRRYFVEVLEVEKELIHRALEIAEEYVTDESLVKAMFVGIAKSVLADVIMELVKQKRKKNELIEAILEREPIIVEGKKEKINIYYDEEALEDFLKELQSLGYIKIKGNKVFW